jgi:hypothetical protein
MKGKKDGGEKENGQGRRREKKVVIGDEWGLAHLHFLSFCAFHFT